METQTDNKPGVIRPWLLITVIVLVVAATSFFTWYYLQKNNALPLPTTSPIATPVVISKVTPKVSPTTTSMTNWKTYNNEEIGFSFKYPVDWVLDSSKQDGITLNSPANVLLENKIKNGEMYGEGYMEDINFSYFDDLKTSEINNPNKYNTLIDMLNDKSTYVATPTEITLGGQKAYETVVGGLGAYYVIFTERNDRFYKILFGNVDVKNDLSDIEKTILSTFQFNK